MLYNVTLVSAVQPRESAICIHMSLRSRTSLPVATPPPHPSRSPQTPNWAACVMQRLPTSWRWCPTPVLFPGRSHGRRSLVGCSPWGCSESDTTEQLHFHTLAKEVATHSSILAWRIPGTAEPGGLPSMGLHRVRHDWSDVAAAAAAAVCLYVNANLLIHPTLSFPCCVPKSSLYVCISTPDLQIRICKVHEYHFSRFYIYALIYNICFSLSDLLHYVWQTLGPFTSL